MAGVAHLKERTKGHSLDLAMGRVGSGFGGRNPTRNGSGYPAHVHLGNPDRVGYLPRTHWVTRKPIG